MNESQAISQLKTGDIRGLEMLVKTYQVRAVQTAYLIVRERALAEDIAQNAFLRVYERIAQYDAARPFAPWFLRIVINDAIKAASRQARNVTLNAEGDEETILNQLLAELDSDPLASAERAEVREQVWEALGKLSPTQRAAIVAHYFNGFSEAEIAERFRSPLGTIKWRMHAAKERLRRLLEPHALATGAPTELYLDEEPTQ